MKTIPAALDTHLSGELATLATLIKISRRDGAVMGFTSHDRDLLVSGVTYKADSAFSASAIENKNTLSADNLEAFGMLEDSGITESDIRKGRYDHARIDVYLCNWADLTQGVVQLRRGWLGEIQIEGGQYRAELRGLHDLLQRPIGATVTPECRHDLGDSGCKIDLVSLTVTGAVTSVTSAHMFADSSRAEAAGHFNGGLLTWTSGPNSGLSMEVKDFTSGQFTLWLAMPDLPAAGNSYSVTPGCDKRFSTCKAKFNNVVNFGGFPHLPGIDKILDYPDARL